MNTKISFLYRDASNYKIFQEVIVSGELSHDQIEDILEAREDGLWFLPSVVGLDSKRFPDENDDDHPWFELHDDSFELTEDGATCSTTADEFYRLFLDASGNWNSISTAFLA